ncbi:MAG: OprO/OprP family phosphate-selective porin, partial [Rickettsiales bacterium]|nr:OprO/OprP family phosphate-selective porin [Rickettsiales bacterium]
EVIVQAEYFWRDEDGTYEDSGAGTGAVNYDESSSGWYAQAVYKFAPEWRVGARYSQLQSADTVTGLVGSALDGSGHDPIAYALMVDWTNSEFSRIRLQYNNEELSDGNDDNQVLLQYIMSLGAHSAHKY